MISLKKILIGVAIFFSMSAFCQPCTTPPSINFNQNTFELCPGESATVIANVLGEVGAITYNWFPLSGNTDALLISPTALETWYYLEITDDCFTVVDSMHAYLNSIVITSLNTTDATDCPTQPGTLGSVQVLPSDPTQTYTLIGGGDSYGPQFSNTFTNLPGGITYFLTIENPYCSMDTVVTIGLGANAVVATWDFGSLIPVSCFGENDGAASISNIGGGILPQFDVSWTHTTGLFDQTVVGLGGSDTINNLFEGNWVVTVTDQEGCAWSHLFVVEEPDPLSIALSANSPTCYGFSDGSVNGIISGGTSMYSCIMTNAGGSQVNFANIPEINFLISGWYFVSVTDANGCTVEDSAFVDDPGQLNIDLILTESLCYSNGNGSAVVDTIYNYSGNYNAIAYFWNPNPNGLNGIGQNTCEQLGGGDHTLTINDQSGCSQSIDFTIISPPELYFDIIGSEPSSGGTDGVVYASALGGTPGYTYLWTNLTTLATSNNTTWGGLLGGDYEIVVTDANGCTLTQVVTVGYLDAEENSSDKIFQICPTIINDGVIHFNNQISASVFLVIYNLQGEIVFQTALEQYEMGLSLDLESGIYFYQVIENQTKTEKIAQGKIVIVN